MYHKTNSQVLSCVKVWEMVKRSGGWRRRVNPSFWSDPSDRFNRFVTLTSFFLRLSLSLSHYTFCCCWYLGSQNIFISFPSHPFVAIFFSPSSSFPTFNKVKFLKLLLASKDFFCWEKGFRRMYVCEETTICTLIPKKQTKGENFSPEFYLNFDQVSHYIFFVPNRISPLLFLSSPGFSFSSWPFKVLTDTT